MVKEVRSGPEFNAWQIRLDRPVRGFCLGPSPNDRAIEQPLPTVSVKEFGAVGDGITDDYDAMKAAAAYICANGGQLLYPPGRYRIGRYRVLGGPLRNDVTNITYSGCRNVTVSGYGATIDVKGDFVRTNDYSSAYYGTFESYESEVIPFEMIHCSNFQIEGFELTGNVDAMRRDPGINESYAHGIATTYCSHYVIRDVNVHHFQTDGIYLGRGITEADAASGKPHVADRDATLLNVRSSHNARQGLSVLQLRDGLFLDCAFSYSGVTGPYGAHAPAAGVDVEPSVIVPAVDVNTGGLDFVNCSFEENLGYEFTTYFPDFVDDVSVHGCAVRTSLADSGKAFSGAAYLNSASVGLTEACQFDLPNGSVILLETPSTQRHSAIQSLVFRDNEVNLSKAASLSSVAVRQVPLTFEGNIVSVRSEDPDLSVLNFRNVSSVSKNAFWIERSTLAVSGAAQKIVSYAGVGTVSENTYSTSLSVGSDYFYVDYSQAGVVTNELFLSGLSFRPWPDVDWNTTYPYSRAIR
jgi:hypothetical protein